MKSQFVQAMALLVFIAFVLSCGPAPQSIALWNGNTFDGWVRFIPGDSVDVDTVWSIHDGMLYCTGKPTGYIRTQASFSNYKLHIEWRWVREGGNSGVLLHCQEPDQVWPNCIEAQLQSKDAGDLVLIGPGQITVAGKTYKNEKQFLIIPNQKDGVEKSLGEWNAYDLVCRDRTIVCSVNGVEINRGENASVNSGWIALQSEGAPIEFRNIVLEKL